MGCPNLCSLGEGRCGPHRRLREGRRNADPRRAAYKDPGYRKTRTFLLDGRFGCEDCGTRTDLTVDHIVPLARGGTNDLSNLTVRCRSCNGRKGAK